MSVSEGQATRKQHERARGQYHDDHEHGDHDNDQSPLSATHTQQLRNRGLTDATIAEAGLWSVTRGDVAQSLGFHPDNVGLAIPFPDPFTHEAMLQRIRPDTPALIGGKLAKYLSPLGAKNRLYFTPNAHEWIRDPSVPFLFCESEFKALWVYQVGIKSVGGIGVWGWRGKDAADGPSRPIDDLNRIVWTDRTVSIVFDSDLATNPDVQRAQDLLALELYRRGVRVIYSIHLPSTETGEKNGVDDYLHAHGREAFLDLETVELPSPYPKIKLWNGAELRKAKMERPPAVVPGWGIRRGGKVILTGMGGKGKSVILLQLACDLAAGRPLLGHAPLDVTEPQRVAVYMAEDPIEEVRFRWDAQMTALGYGPEVEERMAFLDPDQIRLSLTNDYARQAMFDTIRQHQATVVMLDPLVSIHDAEENANAQMRAVLDLFGPLQKELGCTIMLAHHEPKSPENNSGSARGASSIRDWCRTMLRLTSVTPAGEWPQRLQLDLDKANYGGTVWTLILERQKDSYCFTSIAVEAACTPMQVWELVGPDGCWFDAAWSALMKHCRVTRSTAYRGIKKAEKDQWVLIEKRTHPETNRERQYLIRGPGPEGGNEGG